MQFRVPNEPRPIQVRIGQQDPRKRLSESRFQVVLKQRLEDDSGWICLAGTQVTETWIPEPREFACELRGVHYVLF